MVTCARMRLAFRILCAACLSAVALAGCGSGGGTYNPAFVGSTVGAKTGSPAPTPAPAPAPTPSFDLAAAPSSVSVVQGSPAVYTLTLTAQNGFATPVTPDVAGLPAGATATFQPTQITPTPTGATVQLTINTTGANGATPTPTGTKSLTVTATDGSVTHRSTVSLVVTQSPPGSLQGNIQ